MYRSPEPARPARPLVLLADAAWARHQRQRSARLSLCCTVCPSPGGAGHEGLARSRDRPEAAAASAARGPGEDRSEAALDRRSQAVGQRPPGIGEGQAVQHPREADSTPRPGHATALPGQLAGQPSGGTFARESQFRRRPGAPASGCAQHPTGCGGVSGLKPVGAETAAGWLGAQHESPTRPPGRGTPRFQRCQRSSSSASVNFSSLAQ